ncbi:MAG: hypothetical protein ACE5KS_07740, partial [Woeseiaceae bacterium]
IYVSSKYATHLLGAVSVAEPADAQAATLITQPGIYLSLAAAVLVIGILTITAFRHRELGEKLIEPGSGLIAMLLYLGLGPAQALLR